MRDSSTTVLLALRAITRIILYSCQLTPLPPCRQGKWGSLRPPADEEKHVSSRQQDRRCRPDAWTAGGDSACRQSAKQNWAKYAANDKTQCVGNVKTGGPASYVELLSCLEIMRDAKAIRQGDLLSPPDQPTGLMRRRR